MLPLLRRLGVCAALALPLSAPAFASDWAVVLPAKAVETQIVGTGVKILVAGGGEFSPDRKAATHALVDDLRAAKTVKLVLTDDALGDIQKLDDAAIIAKAKGQPVDQFWVVRVFPGQGSDLTAVVTMYRPDGSVLGAFTAGTAEPLAEKTVADAAPAPSTGAGLSSQAAATLETATKAAVKDRDAAIKEYEERAILSRSFATVDASSGQILSTSTVLYKGKYGEALRGAKLYEYLGRDDLAKQYRSRAGVNTGIFLGSLAAMGAGTYLLIDGLTYTNANPDSKCKVFWHYNDDYEKVHEDGYDDCVATVRANNQDRKTASQTETIAGGVLGGVGFIGIYIPLFRSPYPTKWNDTRRMVDDFNENLRKELGLEESTGSGSYGYEWSVAAEPWVGPGASGATLTVSF